MESLSNDEYFMRLAIEEAKNSSESIRCGCVIVLGNEVIAKAHSSQRSLNDASAHAEINALRLAGKKLGNKNIEEGVMYCTCEPCIMCISAMAFAKIKKLLYGLILKEAFPKERIIDIDIDTLLTKSAHKIQVVKNFMRDECRQLLTLVGR